MTYAHTQTFVDIRFAIFHIFSPCQTITGMSGTPNCGTRVILTAAPGELHLSHSTIHAWEVKWFGI